MKPFVLIPQHFGSLPEHMASWVRRRRLLLPGLAGLVALNAFGLSWAMGTAQAALSLALVQAGVLLAAAALLLALRAPRQRWA